MPQRHPRSLVPPPRRDGASSLLSPKLQALVYDFLPRSECSLSLSQSRSWRTWASTALVCDFLPRSECSLSLSQSRSWRTWASTVLVYDFLPSLGVYSQSWPKQVLVDLGVYSSGLRLPFLARSGLSVLVKAGSWRTWASTVLVYDFLPRSECTLSLGQSRSWWTWVSTVLVYDFLPRSECSLSLGQSRSWRTWASTDSKHWFTTSAFHQGEGCRKARLGM